MLKEDLRFKDSLVFEGMTSIRAILRSIDEGISDRRIETILYDEDRMKKIQKEVGYLRAVSEKYGFQIIASNAEKIALHTIGNSHGGIIAITSARTIPPLTEDAALPRRGFYVMIQGIEDPYNFGYSLRSLYACGCDGIVLPERNWMSAAGVVARSSAGASELFPIYTADALDAARIFKSNGYTVACADENTDLILGKCELKLPIFLIVGGEKRGISASLMEMSDMIVKIPYAREFKASLSAASATTMLAYEIARQNF